jgi:hypothetical protein
MKDKVIKTDERESVGSTKIIEVRCKSPEKDLTIAVGGLHPWIKICGQNFAPEGWDVPEMTHAGLPGANGTTPSDEHLTELIKPLIPAPLKGDKGDDGKTIIQPAPAPSSIVQPKKEGWLTWKKTFVIVSLGLAGGTAWAIAESRSKATATATIKFGFSFK